MLIKKKKDFDPGNDRIWFSTNGLVAQNKNKNMRRVSRDDFSPRPAPESCLVHINIVDYAPKPK